MEERYYVITVQLDDAGTAFDGSTLCPMTGWERMSGAVQEHCKYNRLTTTTPVGLFSPEVLGRGVGRGSASLIRVWCNGPVVGGDIWDTKANHAQGEGEPTGVQRELPSALSTNPADAPPKELGPTDDLSVRFQGERGGTITIVVVDISEEEYLAWVRARWLTAHSAYAPLTTEEITITEAGSIPTPTRDLTFVHVSAELNDLIVLPDPAQMSLTQELFIDNVGPNDIVLSAAIGRTVNGTVGGSAWQQLTTGQGCYVRKVNATAHTGTTNH